MAIILRNIITFNYMYACTLVLYLGKEQQYYMIYWPKRKTKKGVIVLEL